MAHREIVFSLIASLFLLSHLGCGSGDETVEQDKSPDTDSISSESNGTQDESNQPADSGVDTAANDSESSDGVDLSEFFPQKNDQAPTEASLSGLKFTLEPYTEVKDGKTLTKGTRKVYTNSEVRRHGKHTHYYDDGKKQSSGDYEEDMKTGTWAFWFPNGEKSKEGAYVDGLAEGKWTMWYENGKIRSQGDHKRSRQVGVWTFYDLEDKKTTKDFSATEGSP
jgi:hypothetical protein